jgi:D-lactate dehydrogenase
VGSDVDVVVFSAKAYERERLDAAAAAHGLHITALDVALGPETAGLARGASVVSVFVNDDVGGRVVELLATNGTRGIALRSAGFNNVDLEAARSHGVTVLRVPSYSPNAVAEHTIALILALNRNIPRAYNRVRDGNFSLDGLVGFDLAGKTAGVVGTGRIGSIVARLLWHLRCRVLAVDARQDEHLLDLGVEYVDLDDLLSTAQIISLNCPLTAETHHLIDESAIGRMQRGVMLVNTGRGALIDATAVIDGLKSGQIGSLALDVYEEEARLFFADRSDEIIADDVFARLLTFPNVLITAHQAFLTEEALDAIAETTMRNVADLLAGNPSDNEVRAPD